MIAQPLASHPLNTLERAVQFAQLLSRELARRDLGTCRHYRVFAALTGDERIAFAAYVLWRARARRT